MYFVDFIPTEKQWTNDVYNKMAITHTTRTRCMRGIFVIRN